jgi:thiosulfate dehydrogenase
MSNNVYYPILWLVIATLAIGLVFISSGIRFFIKKMNENPTLHTESRNPLWYLGWSHRLLLGFTLLMTIGGGIAMYIDYDRQQQQLIAQRQQVWPVFDPLKVWNAPDPFLATTDANAELITYGRDLVAHTQDYFGEYGLVRAGSINGMNCQNCHLNAGSTPFGNNYFAVQSTYPQMRARSGAIETIPKRINDCFQRSLNGQPLDTTSHEMKAIIAYMKWLGTGVPKGAKPKGIGLVEVPFLERAADPTKGQVIYQSKCASCHGINGQGLPIPDGARDYPPLWGDNSYNEAAGLFRLSRFAGYVKANMPFGANYQNPQLSDEEAWDLAAFVNTQPRPKHPFLDTDWPKIEKKPFDHPFGPYKDTFPEIQHKYGPFGSIVAYYKKQ